MKLRFSCRHSILLPWTPSRSVYAAVLWRYQVRSSTLRGRRGGRAYVLHTRLLLQVMLTSSAIQSNVSFPPYQCIIYPFPANANHLTLFIAPCSPLSLFSLSFTLPIDSCKAILTFRLSFPLSLLQVIWKVVQKDYVVIG